MSVLYVVATPIGNLEDLSPRAKRVLQEADLILAEDTRVTRRLLNAFQIRTRLESCHEHNELVKSSMIVRRMEEEGLNVALVTDAGTPGISDPGAGLIAAAWEAGIQVLSVPGPSAFVSALSLSGFEETEFTFFGFLPRKKKELTEKLKGMAGRTGLAVLYESPHRVLSLLSAVAEVFPGIQLSLSRELTKLHEQTIRGTAEELLAQFQSDEGLLRGEFCLVLQLVGTRPVPVKSVTGESLEGRLTSLMLDGCTLRDASEMLLERGEKKNAVYAASLNLKRLARSLLPEDEKM